MLKLHERLHEIQKSSVKSGEETNPAPHTHINTYTHTHKYETSAIKKPHEH